jgi:hypothetical protein
VVVLYPDATILPGPAFYPAKNWFMRLHQNNKGIKMNKILALMLAAGFLLSGCVVVPLEEERNSGFCPPGQAKKGNCTPNGGFCPPGQAKKGNC